VDILPFISVVEDLNRDLSDDERYMRLILAIKQAVPCDAIALLKLKGDVLTPLATIGLKHEAMARQFVVKEHPRLEQIIGNPSLTRFESDSNLPDPYDGLVEGELEDSNLLKVHDCMGTQIQIDGQLWGVLTLDALTVGTFDAYNATEIRAYIAAIEAALKTHDHIHDLEDKVDHNQQLVKTLIDQVDHVELIGKSQALVDLQDEIDTVAFTDLTVLVTGETGVGKELTSRLVHQESRRNDQPFIQLNCAALPDNLIESELFGHVKGAFTGASSNRPGRFELADGGTLFLDEIGELPLAAQAKILRAIENGEIQRLGSDQVSKVNVRLIAATNRNLEEAVENGEFRSDLYHRISVYPIYVPSLRERGKDIEILAGYFLERMQQRFGVNKLHLSDDARQLITQYDWPGNVRELEHILSRAALKAIKDQRKQMIITIDHVHLGISVSESNSQSSNTWFQVDEDNGLRELTDQFQIALIRQQLEQHEGKISAAAKSLKLDRSNFVRMLDRLNIPS